MQRIQHLFTQLAWKNVANVLITASILKASKAIDELENPSYKEKQKHYTEKKIYTESLRRRPGPILLIISIEFVVIHYP